MKAYWWQGQPNFGDRLTPLILGLGGIEAEHATPAQAEIVACGSVLTHMPKAWDGIVYGTGKAHHSDTIDLSKATVLALRGKLSAKGSQATGDYVLGDPGLLISMLGVEPSGEFGIGIVPHWEDRHLARKFSGKVINVRAEPLEVIRQIASCQRIVSSSLHGIIAADAFGLERRWEVFGKIQGHGFKFTDYGTVVGPLTAGVWAKANRGKVESAQRELRDALGLIA